ncbi:MAG: SurA N-terminal domain-containing protein, partial [Acetobacteraceae bacterium]|nr:SurA N-terminal domain-containing protein [Acetobacteraceae bacterium]
MPPRHAPANGRTPRALARAAGTALLGAAVLLAAVAGPVAAQLPSPGQVAPQGNRIVAVVNGEAVSRSDIVGRARLFALNAGIAVPPEMLERLIPQVTRLVVDERLRMQEVQRRRVPVSDADVAEAVRELEQRNNLSAGVLRAQLSSVGVQPRVLYDQIRTQIGWARLLRLQLGPQAEPSEEEVQETIRNAQARVGQPEYLVSEIFIPIDDPRSEG